ncbi:MAG TPA: molybdopterin cofactor-binding domain-containing protein [Phycisphaerae bacterium]|nr:molybdopterin cofactor-binding domain-containing protein [Phycisphaerae bacterium]
MTTLLRSTRRGFLQGLGAGLLITITDTRLFAQAESGFQGRRGGRAGRGGAFGGAPVPISARIHIAHDGAVTVLSGKVECGQGARAEIGQAAAEELRLHPDQITVLLCDTTLCPNDGGTFGSQTTPRTIPVIRAAAAAARLALLELASRAWSVPAAELDTHDGKVLHAASHRETSFGDLAASDQAAQAFSQIPRNVTVTPVKDWKVMGAPAFRHDQRDMVTGRHAFPTDITRPGMLYGKILRPPALGSTLTSLDATTPIDGVTLVHDNDFAGVVAPTSFAADNAIAALAPAAKWSAPPTNSSETLAADLRASVRGGVPTNPFPAHAPDKLFQQSYFTPYIQHAPLEPRTAVAEWAGSKLTVWTATQNPFSVRSELARAFSIPEDDIHLIVPDFGGAFGGKHTGECAIEAARLAKAAGKPVILRWSRAEEFTFAYFRPAAVIDVSAALTPARKIASWFFVNINSGNSGIDSPYAIPSKRSQYVTSAPPLRHGSYRGLAATANNFARECAMNELAALASADPLDFRLKHLDDSRLRDVLQAAADKFNWGQKLPEGHAAGLACGTEKGSYVAACAEVSLDKNTITVHRVVQTFECGAIVNPLGLTQQVQGAITQGLGPTFWEQIRFTNGHIENAAFAKYRVPRFSDLPQIDVHLLDRKDIPSAGAGETPLICIAPAITNALTALTHTPLRALPLHV